MNTHLFLLCILITSSLAQLNPISEGRKHVQKLTYENFAVTVDKGRKTPYFVLFKMAKCGHCKRFEPTFYKLAYDTRKEPVQFAINSTEDDSE